MFRSLTLCVALTAAALVSIPSGTAHAHGGFYTRAGIGLGYISTTQSFMGTDATTSSMAIPLELLLGGGITEQFVLGGGLMVDYGPSPSVESGGTSVDLEDTSIYVVDLSLFGDYYFAPASPWHAQLRLGWGGLESSQDGDAGGSDPTGLAITAGVGYDHFLSETFGVGAMIRYTYGMYSYNDVDYPTSDISLVASIVSY